MLALAARIHKMLVRITKLVRITNREDPDGSTLFVQALFGRQTSVRNFRTFTVLSSPFMIIRKMKLNSNTKGPYILVNIERFTIHENIVFNLLKQTSSPNKCLVTLCEVQRLAINHTFLQTKIIKEQ